MLRREFFGLKKKLKKAHKLNSDKDSEEKAVNDERNESNSVGEAVASKAVDADLTVEIEDDEEDDDDFIVSEVKRRFKELRRNSFLVLIPEEEPCDENEEDEDEGGEGEETSSSEWRDFETERMCLWGDFDTVYDKYCERMLFFDRIIFQHLADVTDDCDATPAASPWTTITGSKKLMSPFNCIYGVKEEDQEMQHLRGPRPDPYPDLEAAYVAQVCLSWETLHSQYARLSQKISSEQQSQTCYNDSAQQFQQFHVFVQRFIENEPFHHIGRRHRPQIYARARHVLPKLLQVPLVKGFDRMARLGVEECDWMVLAADLMKIMQASILSFYIFLKTDRKKSSSARANRSGVHIQLMLSSLNKKMTSLKELKRKNKKLLGRRKKKSWPETQQGVEQLFGVIEVKILLRVLRMVRISKEHLFWCEEKIKRLNFCFSDTKCFIDPCPLLFPCLC